MMALAAAMTTPVTYGYADAEATAAATAQEQFDGAVIVASDWEVIPVMRIFDVERRCRVPNWDGHHSAAVDRRVVTLAIGLVRQIGAFDIDLLPQPHVGPIAAGGLGFEFQFRARELSLSIFNDTDSISYLKSEQGEPFEEGQLPFVSPSSLRELLVWLIAAVMP